MEKLRLKTIILLVIVLSVSGFCRNVQSEEPGLYLKNISADSVGNVLLVDKSKQRLLVLKSSAPQSVTIFDTFRITSGKVDGNKEKEGDQKTPEGIYWIISSIPGKLLPAIYGPVAFVLDYPNLIDKIQRRNGSNIWIHGRDEEIVDRQTEGCISLENGRLLDLSEFITISETPVIIIDTLFHNGHSEKYHQKFSLSDSLISKWTRYWEQGNIESFGNLFSPYFSTGSWKSKTAYLNNKKHLETVYRWKKVDLEKIWILQSDHEALVNFQQNYLCPNFYSQGNKQLRLIWADSVWQIIDEDFEATRPRIYLSTTIEKFLSKWQADWQSGDVEQYICNYDSAFSSKTYPTIEDWATYKKRIFTNSKNITLDFSDITISSTDALIWTVTFIQKYQAGTYQDIGRKTIRITGHPKNPQNFKILSEEWESIK